LELDPALSPDGRAVAFSANRNGRFEIYLQQLAPGSREIQLTDDQTQSFQPTWSPDGAYLAYASHGRGGIWVLPAFGGTPRQLTTFGSHPAWSPDGRTLAFQSEPSAELSASAVPALPPSTLWVVPAQGGAPSQVTREGTPSGGHGAPQWSPDGRRLVFSASDRRGSAIWTVRPDGSDVRLATDSPAFCFDPLVTSDGRRLLFAGIAAGERYAIWAMPVDRDLKPTGAAATIYSLPMASARQLSISHDGTRLVHAAFGTSTNLWKLPLDPATAEPTQIAQPLTTGSGRHSRPVFSSSGTLLAYDRRQVGSSQQVWLLAMDGSEPRQLTSGPSASGTPSFLPGGAGVAFVSEQDGQLALWKVDLGGGTPQRLRELPARADGVRVAPDGRQIVFHRAAGAGGVNLWLAEVGGGEPCQLTFDPELLGFGCISPDGCWIAAERRRGDDDQLVIVPVAGGEPVGLSSGRGRYWPHSWSPDGARIAVAGLRDGRWNLFWVATADREMRQLTFFDSLDEYVRYPAWSPRGDCIVFVRAQTFGDLWMVENL
jgi:Tol biopolymer transport system component